MIIQMIIILVILAIGIVCAYFQYKEDEVSKAVLSVIGAIALSIFSSFAYDWLKPILWRADSPTPPPIASIEPSASETDIHDDEETTSPSPSLPSTSSPPSSSSPSISPTTNSPFESFKDVSGEKKLTGEILTSGDKTEYIYIPSLTGVYRFETDRGSGESATIRISSENRKTIDYNTNALTINLEAGKTYILSIEYRDGPCKYTIYINTPNALLNITGMQAVSGEITYIDQKNQYVLSTTVGGTYRFQTDRSAGENITVRVSGENGKSIDYNTNAMSINLEAGKTYIVSIEYRSGPCKYTLSIGSPQGDQNITGVSQITGNITYIDQKNRYIYTAPVSGIYRFDTNRSSGSDVTVRVSGENGNGIDYNTNSLSIELEANKTYIISIDYRNSPCNYTLYIGVPKAIEDISGLSWILGSITYKNQKDQYIYTASVNGTYRFETDRDAGSNVTVRIRGESGNSIDYGTNSISINLEAGKTYIIDIEYKDSICDYTMSIGCPTEMRNITGLNYFEGSITYKDQKDKYYYIAPIDGKYNFSSNRSAGSKITIRISGENGISLNYNTNELTMNLEAGKVYILSVEYRDSPCNYAIFINLDT